MAGVRLCCTFLLVLQHLHPSRLPAVPKAATMRAVVSGMTEGVRYWALADPAPLLREAQASVERERRHLEEVGHTGPLPPAHYLAMSGGGDNGAFGAGLLVGWTEAGTRPEFKIVTGISTGALAAPLAFLGAGYDRMLEQVFTTVSTKQILKRRRRTAAIFSDALLDATPLWKLVARFVDAEMLSRIAAERQKGRMLLVATTDLDARQPVMWDMGAIAASEHPRSLELFHAVLIASAAIPGAFPPVMIDVEVDRRRYQEMHVDGGALAQVFVYPASLHAEEAGRARGAPRERTLYIIRNARLDPDWAFVERQTLSIGGRAISALLQSQGIGDLYRIYALARRDEVDYNLAYIPEDFSAPRREEFDPGYMRALFERGRQLAVAGYHWAKAPPGYASD